MAPPVPPGGAGGGLTARHENIWAAVAAVVLATSIGRASAAPYCVTVQGLPDQCLYADGAECRRRAITLGGVCNANPAEIATPPGPGRFCLVEGGRATSCVYPDRNSCDTDAARRHSACIQASGPPPGSVDPFAPRRPY